MMQSMKLLSIRYFLIFCSAPPLYIMPGKQTIAAVPFGASQERLCIINAMSALLFGASTPAGEKRGSFINNGLSVVLPLASAYTGIYLNSALHKAKELENTRKNKNEAINAIASGSLEEQRKFLQDRYPGLFDSITRPTEKKKIKIVNVEKLRDHYNEKSKENKSIVNKLLLSSVGSIGISLLLMKFNMMNAAAIGGAGFSQIGTACLLPLLSTLAGVKINSSVHGLVESENLTKEHNRVSYLIKYGSEEEKRTFLQKRYPGLYDSILENYENSKGMSR